MKRRAFELFVVVFAATLLASPAFAQAASIEARIENDDVSDSSDDRPISLDPETRQVIHVIVRNNSDELLTVRSIRLRGDVMGLTFFSYDTAVGMRVQPGRSDERRYELDLFGLGGQAVGLMGSRVIALNEDRDPVAEVEMVADVKGSLGSVYGIFGLAITAFTLLTFADVLIRLKKRRLPANRWFRAMRFFTPGFGLGLSLIFTLSAFRIYHPTTGKWVALLFGSAAIFFLFGYLTPSPVEDDDREATPAPLQPMSSVPVKPRTHTSDGAATPGTAVAPPPEAKQAAPGHTVVAPAPDEPHDPAGSPP